MATRHPNDIDQSALDGIVLEALRPVAAGFTVLFLLFAAGHMAVLTGAARDVMVPLALASAIVLGAIAWLAPSLPRRLAQPAGLVVAATVLTDANPLAALDTRDREILALLVQGLGPSQIAGRLFLAPKTVRNRISTMLTKLGVATRQEAVALGVAGGLGA